MTESFTDCVQFHWQRRRGEIIDHFRRLWAAPELPMMETQANCRSGADRFLCDGRSAHGGGRGYTGLFPAWDEVIVKT